MGNCLQAASDDVDLLRRDGDEVYPSDSQQSASFFADSGGGYHPLMSTSLSLNTSGGAGAAPVLLSDESRFAGSSVTPNLEIPLHSAEHLGESGSGSVASTSGNALDAASSYENQIRLAQRLSFIRHLPTDVYVKGGDKSNRECVICTIEFEDGEHVRFLPCLHCYHLDCIDSWLMRSLTCPICMEPVDAALLTTYLTS